MGRHHVEVHQDGPARYRVLIDGMDITKGLAGLSLHMGVDQVPRLELDLLLVDMADLGPIEAEVRLRKATHEALVVLGWTPPAAEQRDPG
ncbi:hypothetical protein ABGT92_23845 [Streptomyces cinereoruber]|uniref:hypothetical protein n=1 Tax=Streptomyces cinereoruber TaxID=67260 RepID=UPI00345DED85